jgi:hypothetical protein
MSSSVKGVDVFIEVSVAGVIVERQTLMLMSLSQVHTSGFLMDEFIETT